MRTALLILLLGLLVLLISPFFFWQFPQPRRQMTQWLINRAIASRDWTASLGAVAGDPFHTLRLEELQLSHTPSGRLLMQLEALEVELDWPSLRQKRVLLRRLHLLKPVIDGAALASMKPQPSVQSEVPSPWSFSIETLAIEEGRAQFGPARAAVEATLHQGEGPFRIKASFPEGTLAISGTLDFQGKRLSGQWNLRALNLGVFAQTHPALNGLAGRLESAGNAALRFTGQRLEGRLKGKWTASDIAWGTTRLQRVLARIEGPLESLHARIFAERPDGAWFNLVGLLLRQGTAWQWNSESLELSPRGGPLWRAGPATLRW